MQNYQSDSVLIIKICSAVIKSFPCNGRACKHCYIVFPSPTLKDCHFPTIHIFTPIFVFNFHWRSWSWGSTLCEDAQINTCRWTDWSIIRGIIWISAALHHLNEGVPWHLWAKINPDNVQQDFRGGTNEGNRSNYKGVKKIFLWTPTAERSQPKRSLLQKHKSNKICFHKSLMFAISHAACQNFTSHGEDV